MTLNIQILTPARPFTVKLDWLGPDGVIIEGHNIPEDGVFSMSGTELATVYIELGKGVPPGRRRALVLGRNGDDQGFWGAEIVNMVKDQVVERTITLMKKPLEDADGDLIPDKIDECPGDDKLGC